MSYDFKPVKGTRDFGPQALAKRKYIIKVITKHFERSGFQQIETPAMESLPTLMGKYGEEGDQLLYKILNSGDFLKKAPKNESHDSKRMESFIAEKGLKYDLTVPFARFISTHFHTLTFPFKRYQIQPVWRADRPQKGRYREFVQCDADIVGVEVPWNEAELTVLVHDIFEDLQLKDYEIKINHRQILNHLSQYCQFVNSMEFCVELDKIHKIGVENVYKNLVAKGGNAKKIQEVLDFISESQEGFLEKLNRLKKTFGIEMPYLTEYFKILTITEKTHKIKLDFSLARGLSYYTGMIFEVVAHSSKIGSICGGGRYENLTQNFGIQNISGVGISFGLDRIQDVLTDLNAFPKTIFPNLEVLVVHLDEACFYHATKIILTLRNNGILAELYPSIDKLKKQLNYAHKMEVKFTLILGQDEVEKGIYTLKNMSSGKQVNKSLEELIEILKNPKTN